MDESSLSPSHHSRPREHLAKGWEYRKNVTASRWEGELGNTDMVHILHTETHRYYGYLNKT